MSEKPTFVLVPGAWSLPHVFDKLRSILSDKDYPSEAPAHPSVGTEPPTAALADDVDHLRNVIRGLIEQEKEVIVVMHSYGGLVGSGAVEGLSKDQMAAEGKIGGVICLVYMAAMMVPVGMSPKDLMGGDFLPFMRVEGNYVYCTVDDENTFHDLPADERRKWADALTHTALPCFTGTATFEPWRSMRTAYILCEDDRAIPLEVQEAMVKMTAPTWTERLNSSHNPHLSMPGKVADLLVLMARRTTHVCLD